VLGWKKGRSWRSQLQVESAWALFELDRESSPSINNKRYITISEVAKEMGELENVVKKNLEY
jgi:hypothetical protein